MLIIKKEQVKMFEDAAKQAFEDRMVMHLNRYFPEQCAKIGEKGVRDSISEAVKRTQELGLYMEYDIERYLNHMYALGFDFEKRYSYVQEIFSDPDIEKEELMDILGKRTEIELAAHSDTREVPK